MSGRSFLFRWSVGLLRREWRQQLGVLSLITIAVALSTGAVVATFNLAEPPGFRYGTGRLGATITGDPAEAITALEDQGHRFGMITSVSVRPTGSARPVPVRAQDPESPVTEPLLTLVSGRWPVGSGEIGVTDGAATESRSVGESLVLGGKERTIVGIVENPTNLDDEFVLADNIDSYGVEQRLKTTELLVEADPVDVTFPAGTWGITTEDSGGGPAARTLAAIAVSMVTSVALLIVSLMIGAAFAAIARRRARQYGLLAAAGGSPRQVRQAVALTGFTSGAAAAVLGAVIGVVATFAIVPRMEESVGHRIGFAVPWWTVVPTVALVVITATVAAWWPARALSRQPVVEVLASVRPRSTPTHWSTRLGWTGLAAGVVLLVIGMRSLSATLVIPAIVISVTGLLLLAPGLIALIGRAATPMPLAGRMAGRSIVRQQSRSGAFVAAIALALAIPVGVAFVTASIDRHDAMAAPNLEANMAIAWAAGLGAEALVIPEDLDHSAMEQAGPGLANAVANAKIAPIRVALDPGERPQPMEFPDGTTVLGVETNFAVLPVDEAACGTVCEVNSLGDRDQDGNEILFSFHEAWVANPALFDALGIDQAARSSGAQAISRHPDGMLKSHRNQTEALSSDVEFGPMIPANSSIAPTLIWPETVIENDWDTVTVGWLVVDDRPLSTEDLADLSAAAGDGMLLESAVAPDSRTGVRTVAAAVGIAIGLGIVLAALALLRAESADDVRLLQSIGAGPKHHRRLAAATAAILAAAGVIIAVPTGFLALLVLLADESTNYRFVVPWSSLLMVIVLLPALAAGAAWLTSRTETSGLGRRQA